VPPRNAQALAAGIVRVLDDPAHAAALGTAARQTAADNFSFERMVAEFERLYRSELSSRAADGRRDTALKATAA
jgi:glycosyltransferase involved in cell wall biosynthesis